MYEQNETMAYSPEMEATPSAESHPSEEVLDSIPFSIESNESERDRSENRGGTDTTEMGADQADPSDPPQSPDPAPQTPDAAQEADSELECLRRELNSLRTQLEEYTHAVQKIQMEYAEFCDLYPNQSPENLPDEVWESVQQGVPLSAAYALAERRRFRTREKAKILNEQNRHRSAGAVAGDAPSYFSVSEVRAMTPAEVRANYQCILRSMTKWQ